MVGTLLEIVGLGLVVPLVGIMTSSEFIESNPVLIYFNYFLVNLSQQTIVFVILIIMSCVYFVKTVFLLGLSWMQAGFNLKIQASLSKKLFESYLHKPWLLYKKDNSSTYVQNVNNEVLFLMQHGFGAAIEIITSLMLLIAAVILLFLIEPVGTLIILITMSFAFGYFLYLSRIRVAHWGRIRKEHEALRLRCLQQALNSTKEIKLWDCAKFFTERFNFHSLNLIYSGRWQSTLRKFPRYAFELLAIIGLTAVIVAMVSSGKALENIAPTIALFAVIFIKLMPSANSVLNGFYSIRYIGGTIDSIHDELTTSHVIFEDKENIDIASEVDITLRNICFSYSKSSGLALKNVNLNIPHGSSIGIIGASGAGKSTLIDIVLGLIAPDSGVVEVNGCDIANNIESWQRHIGYVPQSIYLLDDTLRRNIAFGVSDDDIDESKVLHAVKQAQLSVLLENFADGLDTNLGENANRLSGGEKQRIALARALYRTPSILILDEATSSLDVQTEQDAMRAIQGLKSECTILIVTHRLSTIKDCDKVVKIDKGGIIIVK